MKAQMCSCKVKLLRHPTRKRNESILSTLEPCAGSGVERTDPLRFLAGCCKRQCLSSLLALFFWEYFVLFIRATSGVLLVCICMCSLSRLFWLSYQYLPGDWLEKLFWGSRFMVRRLSPQGPGRRMFMNFGLVCIVVVLLCVCVVLRPCRIYLVLLWQNIACFWWKCH